MQLKYTLRWVLFCTFIASLCLGALGIGLDIMFHTHLSPKIELWKAIKNEQLNAFRKDQRHYQQHPFFLKDAEPALPQNIMEGIPEFWQQGLAITPEDKQTVLGLKHQWVERRFKLPKKPVHILFDAIESYTHFQLQREDLTNPSVFPFDFVALSQIYLASKADEDASAQNAALAKVLVLAKILLQSSHHDFQLSGLSILEKGKDFLEYKMQRMPAAGKVDTLEMVSAFSSLDARRFRNFLYNAYEYLDFLAGTPLLQSVFLQESPWPPGFCSIIERKYSDLLAMESPLAGHLIFEPSFSSEISTMDRIRKRFRSDCPRSLVDTRDGLSLEPIKFSWATHIPFLRRIVALNYLLKHKSMARVR